MHTQQPPTGRYPKDSAGHRMTSDVPVVPESALLGDVHTLLREHARSYDTINYVYVVDEDKKLVGVLSARDIFTHDPASHAGRVCRRDPLYFVHPDAHQERAANLALRHSIKAIPVVDRNRVFLGEIAAETILGILHKEMHEDSLKRAGIRHSAELHAGVLQMTLLTSLRHRIPWLLAGLAGGLVVAKIVTLFETTLAENIVLASFIPLIVYMSDAVRAQMEAYIIRDLALDRGLPFVRYLLKQTAVVLILAALLSLLLGLAHGFVQNQWHVALVLGASLSAAITSSVFTGLLIPYAFDRLKMDPADASGPVATIVQDMVSVLLYFTIATALL